MNCQDPREIQDQMVMVAMEGDEEDAVVEGLVEEEEMVLTGVAQEEAEDNLEDIQMQDLLLVQMGGRLKFTHHIISQPTFGM